MVDIARMLQELSDENVDNCRELENDSDVRDKNIEDNNFNNKILKKSIYRNITK